MSELSVMAELIANLCARSESLFPVDKPHRLTSPGQVNSLASACTAAMRRAAIAQFKGTPQASTELDVATRLLHAFQVMGACCHLSCVCVYVCVCACVCVCVACVNACECV